MQSCRQVCPRVLTHLLTLSIASLVLGTPLLASVGELPRHALVIGNAAYQMAPLANPVNDARAMQSALTKVGFDVITLENASQAQMHEAIRRFADRLSEGGIGLFYFSGHAVQIQNRNFLIPVDARFAREEEVQYQALDAGQVLDILGAAKNPINIFILDACRSNPFPRSTRSADMGLSQMDAPVGAIIAFATAPGAQALEGQGKNGIYTEHLVKRIAQPGIKIEDIFKRVRSDVRRVTNGAQIPWESSSLEVDFYFVPPPTTSSTTQERDLSFVPPTDRGVEVVPKATPQFRVPTYHALIIANRNYRHLSRLQTPFDDAIGVEKVLRTKYGFRNITALRDATRADITSALIRLRTNLTTQDSLLIYYAGHGHIDSETKRGYWQPIDADRNDETNWVSTDDVTNYLKGMHARHVLVVSDSCYSGTLTRGADSSKTKVGGEMEWINRMMALRARTALTSGGLEPVEDQGGEGHSVFARAFLEVLWENDQPREMDDLFQRIKRRVVLNAQQTPEYSDIRFADHNGGDFVFVPVATVPQ